MSTPRPAYVEPASVRQKLAEAYRHESQNNRWKKTERAMFALMAESWQRTLEKTTERNK